MRILFALVFVVVVGCSSATRFDASSIENAELSAIEMADELEGEKQEAFKEALSYLMREEEGAYKKYDGKTADQIITTYLRETRND